MGPILWCRGKDVLEGEPRREVGLQPQDKGEPQRNQAGDEQDKPASPTLYLFLHARHQGAIRGQGREVLWR